MNHLHLEGADLHHEIAPAHAAWFARGLAWFACVTPLLIVAYAFAVANDPAVRAQIVVGGLERAVLLTCSALAARAVHAAGQALGRRPGKTGSTDVQGDDAPAIGAVAA